MLENKDVQVIKVLKDSESRSDKFLRGLIETADVMKGTLRMSPHQNRVDKKNMDRNLNVRDGEDVKHPLEVFSEHTEPSRYIFTYFYNHYNL